MSHWKAYTGVARLPFLLLPVTLVASGAAAASRDGAFGWPRTVLALVGLVALHVAVNTLNEASDMRTGIDRHTRRTPFSGGSGTLPSGALSIRAATAFGLAAAAVGLAIGLWFLLLVGWILAPLLVFGAIAVLAYTNLLARIGVGEIAAGLGLGTLPVLGTALVQDGHLGSTAIAASIPAGLMTFNLLLLNEFPDETADRAGGRRNLILLLGRQTAATIYSLAALAVPVSIVVAVVRGIFPLPALLALLPSLLLFPPLAWALRQAHDPVPLPALGANVAWNLATNSVLAAAIALTTIWLA
jgi:1,4-dihydroxy-2-naphthoate octaprenyltransferase